MSDGFFKFMAGYWLGLGVGGTLAAFVTYWIVT